MSKGSKILIASCCCFLAGQSAQALTYAAPVSALSAIGAVAPEQTCTCVLDQDGSGSLIQIQDVLIVFDCAEGNSPTTCDNADLNCDGLIDLCDASRVWCAFIGGTNCCEADMGCGACCHLSTTYSSQCMVTSEQFCFSPIFDTGIFHGAGTTCDPYPCDTPPQPECTSNADCVDDGNVCTSTICNDDGVCETNNKPNGTLCLDDVFCNGSERCQAGVCQSGTPLTCDDGFSCTLDNCNTVLDTCEHTPTACNNDGVCDSPCENDGNCPNDCSGCYCKLDQDGNLSIQIQDILNVLNCADGISPVAPLTCDFADINCDGVIDYCDASRVYDGWLGGPNSCEMDMACGACCHTGTYWEPCIEISEAMCTGVLVENGIFRGAGSSCDPYPCDTPPPPECTADADCDDNEICTTDACTIDGLCEHIPLPNQTPCPDGLFCNGDEVCLFEGKCSRTGGPRNCSDYKDCTVDTCIEETDTCVHADPTSCNNDGVCDRPCETKDNCLNDCPACVCELDQDADGIISLIDGWNVIECMLTGVPIGDGLSCDYADTNCDGVLDFCDVSRVVCAYLGGTDCCTADITCGSCCHSGTWFDNWAGVSFDTLDPCLEISQEFCESQMVHAGTYNGDGATCDPDPCSGAACTSDTDCDDLDSCTIDTCNSAQGVCMSTPVECNNNGVCDACENATNCANDCASSTCATIRDLSAGSSAYCPETTKTIHIVLNFPAGTVSGAVEDIPPTGWTQISNISDGGFYDAVNHKVKWGPLFAPFPAELTYDVIPPVDAAGSVCYTGLASLDGGAGEPICGDECIEDSCCPDSPADGPHPACTGCSGNCSAIPGDGRVELCEVIGYACAWKRGCNDDITGVSGGAYIWMTSECYCWDAVGNSWNAETCGQSPSGCCAAAGQAGVAATSFGSATITLDSISRDRTRRFDNAKARGFEITVSIDPPIDTSAVAFEIQIPKGLQVSDVSDGGEWDRLHNKVKWGPFFSEAMQTVTITVHGSMRRAQERGFTGTVSYDGKNYPISME